MYDNELHNKIDRFVEIAGETTVKENECDIVNTSYRIII